MNNIKSQFTVSVANRSENTLLKKIRSALLEGGDPIQVWAAYENMADEDMAHLLGCTPAQYRQHVVVSDRRIHPAYSPLTSRHIIGFCYRTKIHPADLTALESPAPEHSCMPQIYGALHMLVDRCSWLEDRALANCAINHEEMRYGTFRDEYADIARIMDNVRMFSDLRELRPDIMRKVDVELVDAVRQKSGSSSAERESLRMLSHTFRKNSEHINLYNVADHFDDYHFDLHMKILRNGEKLRDDGRAVRLAKRNLVHNASVIFGEENVNHVLHISEKLIDFLSGETDLGVEHYPESLNRHLVMKFFPDMRRVQALNDRISHLGISAEQAVRDWTDGYCSYISKKHEVKAAEEKFSVQKREQNIFDLWYRNLELPEFRFVHYLYSNQVIGSGRDRQLFQPVKLNPASRILL